MYDRVRFSVPVSTVPTSKHRPQCCSIPNGCRIPQVSTNPLRARHGALLCPRSLSTQSVRLVQQRSFLHAHPAQFSSGSACEGTSNLCTKLVPELSESLRRLKTISTVDVYTRGRSILAYLHSRKIGWVLPVHVRTTERPYPET